MLDFGDIQHFLLTRTPALAARYEFLSFPNAARGRAWLRGILEKVGTAKAVGSSTLDARWVTVGLTWNGLRALGVDQADLDTFPVEFREGMAARAGIRVVEYAPSSVKLAVTGSGRSDKATVAKMVKLALLMNREPPPDAGDALACAIAHARAVVAERRARAVTTKAAA